MELLVLIVLSHKQGRDPKKLAKGLGLSGRRVQNAWTDPDPEPTCKATETGRNIAGAALVAAELAAFEPQLLQALRAHELKAPFPRTDRPGGL